MYVYLNIVSEYKSLVAKITDKFLPPQTVVWCVGSVWPAGGCNQKFQQFPGHWLGHTVAFIGQISAGMFQRFWKVEIDLAMVRDFTRVKMYGKLHDDISPQVDNPLGSGWTIWPAALILFINSTIQTKTKNQTWDFDGQTEIWAL